jgi:hypothetical protein
MLRNEKAPARRRHSGSRAEAHAEERSAPRMYFVNTVKAGGKARYVSDFRRHAPKDLRFLNTDHEVVRTFLTAPRHSMWFAPNDAFVVHLAKAVHEPVGDHRLILFGDLKPASRELLGVYFRHVLFSSSRAVFLAPDELGEVVKASNRADLFIGGIVEKQDKLLILFRGDLEPLVVPLSWFVSSKASPKPDISHFAIEDYGHTVRLGAFEAASDAILYEFDPDFRKRANQQQRQLDQSFGGSLRRLRLQKRVSRNDFTGVTAKTIARIERNEVERPRHRTLQLIAKRLGVADDELGTF